MKTQKITNVTLIKKDGSESSITLVLFQGDKSIEFMAMEGLTLEEEASKIGAKVERIFTPASSLADKVPASNPQ